MDEPTRIAFQDELQKISGLANILQRFADMFRGADAKAKRRVDYHFSPKAGTEKWRAFLRNVGSQDFVMQLAKHPDADPQLVTHAQSMYNLRKGKPVGKVMSAGGKGKSYEIKELPSGGFGCTCPDWRYVGSVNPGYACKHIKAFNQGQTRVAS